MNAPISMAMLPVRPCLPVTESQHQVRERGAPLPQPTMERWGCWQREPEPDDSAVKSPVKIHPAGTL